MEDTASPISEIGTHHRPLTILTVCSFFDGMQKAFNAQTKGGDASNLCARAV